MTKRANGEGCIYKRPDGRWSAAITNGDKRTWVYGKRRADVVKKLAVATKRRDDGLPMLAERQTVGQFLNSWIVGLGPNVRAGTLRGYESKTRVHLVPGLGRILLARLTPQDVQAFLSAKIDAGLSPRTVQHLRAILRAALNDALRWGLVGRNAAALVDGPRVPQGDVRPLAPAEARTLLETVRGDRLEALYTVALAMGLRQGEALGLRWDDIDLDAGVLTVQATLQRVNKTFTLAEPKTARSRRTLPLPDRVGDSLRAHRTRQLEERLAAGPMWEDQGLVFSTRTGGYLHGSNVTRDFQRILAHAGLPQMRFHDMRHACASLLLAQGVQPRVVMEVLGHSQIALTMNLYAHVLPEAQRDAAISMNAVLTGNT